MRRRLETITHFRPNESEQRAVFRLCAFLVQLERHSCEHFPISCLYPSIVPALFFVFPFSWPSAKRRIFIDVVRKGREVEELGVSHT